MGSQVLEILRQGVWASLTGGWFFDPHQSVFCNTFHLYLWLLLLSLPLIIYLYFPPIEYIWYAYCVTITIIFTTIKLINMRLHHMYDTTECIQIEIDNNQTERERREAALQGWKQKREDEGIELQVLTDKRRLDTTPQASSSYMEPIGAVATDADSLGSTDYPKNSNCNNLLPGNTIDLKVDVHRKNSSESSEEISFRAPGDSLHAHAHSIQYLQSNRTHGSKEDASAEPSSSGKYSSEDVLSDPLNVDDRQYQIPKTLTVDCSHAAAGDSNQLQICWCRSQKLSHQTSIDSEDSCNLAEQQPSLQSFESGAMMLPPNRRHSNANNGSLGCLSGGNQVNIKPTGSVELGYIDNNANIHLVGEGFNCWNYNNNGNNNPGNDHHNGAVRRIRSTALETHCPPPTNLVPHPNSLEVIGATNRNPVLPPPSSTLVRNQHLSLCPYFTYGSEIVYPIAEQSDEHQTSHGPDTDADSIHRNSDSEYDENNGGSRSPLLVRVDGTECVNVLPQPCSSKTVEVEKKDGKGKGKARKSIKTNPYCGSKHGKNYSSMDYSVTFQKQYDNTDRAEHVSNTSKDALLENDASNSSPTPEMQDANTDCNATDNDYSEKKLSECSLCTDSDTSEDISDKKSEVSKTNCSEKQKHPKYDNRTKKQTYDNRMNSKSGKGHHNKNRQASVPSVSKSDDVEEQNTDWSSLVSLDCLFENTDSELESSQQTGQWRKEQESESSSTTLSTENEVQKINPQNKVILDVQPLAKNQPSVSRSSGAVPKQIQPSALHRQSFSKIEYERRPRVISTLTKSESERRSRKRHNMMYDQYPSMKEGHGQANVLENDCAVEGLECLVNSCPQRNRPNKRVLSRTSSKGVTRSRRKSGYVNEASPSSSNNELSTLLPAPATPLLAAFLESRRNMPMPVHRGVESVVLRPSSPPRNCRLKRGAPISRRARHNPHVASSHNDTSDGSMHCFRDEFGSWWTYTFDERGTGMGFPIVPAPHGRLLRTLLRNRHTQNQFIVPNNEAWPEQNDGLSNSSLSLNSSGLTVVLDSPTAPVPGPTYISDVTVDSVPLQLTRRIIPAPPSSQGETDAEISLSKNRFRFNTSLENTMEMIRQPKHYYKYKIWPRTYIKIIMDRLNLLALLDRNLSLLEMILSISLAVTVSCLGSILLMLEFYKDAFAFLFCFVIAGCQYSLLKSVQPDAASPTHGFNRIMAFSRPVYFCLCSGIIILLHHNLNDTSFSEFRIYGMCFTTKEVLTLSRDILSTFLLCFPIAFSLGLFPQIDTFMMYLLEQIDMHIFGGNAMSSLLASFYAVARSILAVILLYGFAYGALIEDKGSQHILFSIFCGCLIACSYHLSRCASDPSNVWNILKTHFWPPEMYHESCGKNVEDKPTIQVADDKAAKKKDASQNSSNKKDNLKSIKDHSKRTNAVNSIKCDKEEQDHIDPLPEKLQKTVNKRLISDLWLCSIMAIFIFGIHCSGVFSSAKSELNDGLRAAVTALGFLLHYIFPQFRKQLPWLCIARPVLRSHEHDQFEVRDAAKVMWFEKVYVYLCFAERNFLYPVVFLIALTQDAIPIGNKFGALGGALILVVCGLKIIRGTYSDASSQYLVLGFVVLFFRWDYHYASETFLIDYFVFSIIFAKLHEFILKLQFVVTYIAPWQITWGSAFHAFAQPFSVPHSAMLFLQTIISAILSTPLNPFLGSAIFLSSYVRPIKFWERDYNTLRVDHSNTRLSSHLERNLGADDNNLNSIFYEHLTRSLQHSLCGDLILGRWGPVSQGDCFVLASDYLNCLIHIIELGNGLVTFQMRGLEFRGTYCQQREVEAISEGVEDNYGCCCCEPGHLPHMLSVNAAFSQRWLAWEVTAAKYVLEGYSISDNSAVSMLQVFDFRKVLITYYVKSIIYYATQSNKLDEWLESQTIMQALSPMNDRNFVDLDPVFNMNIDEDFDFRASGITKLSFCNVYYDWIHFCAMKRSKPIDKSRDSNLVLLCFALSLLGRRALGAVSHNTVSSVEFFLYGLHALFKGDFRITSVRDEWVFTDMELLRRVVVPAVRMSLKLHQDHFMAPDEYDEPIALFHAISEHNQHLVISHEGDPAWRSAVLSGTSSLLALRHVLDDGSDEYKIIMLNKRFLSFRVIKVNRECVRGLWAGQQQELVYLRNRNPERGSIQNAKQALRNIINSSCDQPIGYPIYVSPLTTSYAETNEQLCSIVGGSFSISAIKKNIFKIWQRVRRRCTESCLSGGSAGLGAANERGFGHEGVYAMTTCTIHSCTHSAPGHSTDSMRASSLGRASLGANRGSMLSVGGKPTSSTLTSLAGLLTEGASFNRKDRRGDDACVAVNVGASERLEEPNNDANNQQSNVTGSLHRVRIMDPNVVYDAINLGRRIDVIWPDERMRAHGGRSYWKDWIPEKGMEGVVVHRWVPSHRDPNKRSHVDRTILLLKIEDKFVPIAESGVMDLGAESSLLELLEPRSIEPKNPKKISQQMSSSVLPTSTSTFV